MDELLDEGSVSIVFSDGKDYMRLALPKFFAKFKGFAWYEVTDYGWVGVSMSDAHYLESQFKMCWMQKQKNNTKKPFVEST